MEELYDDEEIITLTDEEGEEIAFALLAQTERDGNTYVALEPKEDNKDNEYVILRVEEDENGEEILVTIDDDDEFDAVADVFDDMFMDAEGENG